MRKRTKFLLLRASIILVFAILAGRVWYVQVVMGSYYKQQADTSKIRLEPVEALRGILYDRNGVPLVYNAPNWRVLIVPHGIPSGQATRIYHLLSRLLGGHPTANQIATVVAANEWRAYLPVPITKRIISTQVAFEIKQLHQELPGVQAEPASSRQYQLDPQQTLSHVLGYTGPITGDEYSLNRRLYPAQHYEPYDVVGSDGVENSMEAYLHGVNGTEQVEVDAGERPVRVLQRAHTVPGDGVYLTIDTRLQREVSDDLATGLARLGVRRGVAIVEQVQTGQILAMAGLPSFDNNWFSTGITEKRYAALLKDPAHPLLNPAIQGQYPPGSTYKIITAAAALQTGVVNANTTYDDTGSIPLRCPGTTRVCQTYYGWKPGGLGPENVVGALAQSSDIYFYTVAGGDPNIGSVPHIGADRLASYAHLFGLASKTGIELPFEAPGFVPSATWFDRLKPTPLVKNPGDQWHIGDTYNMAIGQGQNLATPLQMVNIAATVANGGTLYQPRIVNRIVGRVAPGRGVLRTSQTIEPFVPSIIRRNFVDPGNLALIQQGMHDSVAWTNWNGTSWLVHDDRIDAAGKTGTAEAPGGPHAWWVGYAPYNNPQIAVVVMVPNANAEGAYAAAPIAHKIFEDYFHKKPINEPGEPLWPLDERQQLVTSSGAQ